MLSSRIASIGHNCRGNQLFTYIRYSKRVLEFRRYLPRQGWINSYTVSCGRICIYYRSYNGTNVIRSLSVKSRPGHRIYCSCRELRSLRYFNSQLSTYVLRTSMGFLSGDEALANNIGGE